MTSAEARDLKLATVPMEGARDTALPGLRPREGLPGLLIEPYTLPEGAGEEECLGANLKARVGGLSTVSSYQGLEVMPSRTSCAVWCCSPILKIDAAIRTTAAGSRQVDKD